MSSPPSAASTDPASWRHRHSPLARFAWCAYLVVVVYASLTPWTGWRDTGVNPFAYLWAPLPRYTSRFDLIINVLAYVPFGALAVAALHPRLRGIRAVALATLGAALVSGTIEMLQTYLPRRIASNVDLATNVAGALVGALLMAPVAEALIDRGRLSQLRAFWFSRDAAVGLVLLGLWPAAQIHPGRMLFGNGSLELDWLRARASAAVDAFGFGGHAFGAVEFAVAEAFITACGMLVAGLALLALMTPHAPRGRLVGTLVVGALLAKTIAYGVRYGPDHAFAWVTAGAIGGLLLGAVALFAAGEGTPRALLRIACAVLIVKLVAINTLPEGPHPTALLRTLYPLRYLNIHAVAAWLAAAWPYVLLAWLGAQVVYARRGRVAASV